jgi:hypothetical protein
MEAAAAPASQQLSAMDSIAFLRIFAGCSVQVLGTWL